MTDTAITKGKLIYPELSYQIIGTAFKVFNKTGYGMSEKYYQRAFAEELTALEIPFLREFAIEVRYQDRKIGRYLLDFLIDNKIIVELKTRPRLGYVHIKQVNEYLRASGKKLALLVYFTRGGIKYRRIINSYID